MVAARHRPNVATQPVVLEEVPLNWNHWIRQSHRWLSIAFTITVIANFAALATGQGKEPPPAWVTYSPLLPLFLLMFSGLYLFALPYTAKWRSRRLSRSLSA